MENMRSRQLVAVVFWTLVISVFLYSNMQAKTAKEIDAGADAAVERFYKQVNGAGGFAQKSKAMLVMPRPDYLATSQERIFGEQIAQLDQRLSAGDSAVPGEIKARIERLRGVLHWNIYTDYDWRFTEAHTHLRELNQVVDRLKKQYTAFVRTRQAATQSYEGYGDGIRRQRSLIREARTTVSELMARQGHMLETMAVNELSRRRERLAEFQIKARFAMADSYDRAVRDQTQERFSQ